MNTVLRLGLPHCMPSKLRIAIFVLALGLLPAWTALAIEEWEQVAESQFDTTFNAITYDGNQFLAVGHGGLVITSPDGVTWTQHNHLNGAEYNGVAYGNGRFVMVGIDTPILSSPDGIAWQAESIGIGESMYGVVYGNGLFVATGGFGAIWTSPDGQAWTRQARFNSSRLNSATLGNSQFVAVGHGGDILTSPDAVTWTPQEESTSKALVSVTYGNGVFVASSLGGEILTSPNGVGWTIQSLAGSFTPLYGVAWGNGVFVAAGDQAGFNAPEGAHLWSSQDGLTWTRRNSPKDVSLFGVAFGGDRFVAVGVSGFIIRSSVVAPPENGLVLRNPLRIGDDFEFEFDSEIGTLYEIQYSEALPVWLKASVLEGTGTVLSFSESTGTASTRVYRVLAQ